jgi:radical SAM superfamily enzyme YgiQ (UPF0313 family)
MKIAFVIDRIGFLEKFSVPILAAITQKEDIPTMVVEYSPDENLALRTLRQFQPDVIGFSVSSIESQRYLEINRKLKQRLSYFSVFGGPHPTFFPEFIRESGVDAVCRGEADLVLPEFLKNFKTPAMYRTENFLIKKNGRIIENPVADLVENLDLLPFPDRSTIYGKNPLLARFPMKAFFTGRGCPYNCSYCFNHIFNRMYRGKGRVIRLKSVRYLIDEIKDVRAKYPMDFIKFHDDIFGLDLAWLEEFADLYPDEIGLPFLSYSRANIITEKYCRLLKKAGCRSTSLAFEVGNEKLRNSVMNRNMTDRQIIAGCKLLNKFGIRTYSLNMLGLPSETVPMMLKTVRFNRRIGVDYADASIFQPYPGTDLTQYCINKGYLDKDAKVYESQFSDTVLKYNEVKKDKIFIIHKLFPLLVDHPETENLLPYLFRLRKNKIVRQLLNYFYRFYYGYFLHSRVYGFSIPLGLRVQMALPVIFSPNRA